MRAYLETLRPRQWIKNLVIFAGLVFDRQLLQLEPLLRVAAAVILFCLVSGLTYTINDILDVEADRLHPQKKNRPIASGRLSLNSARLLALVLSLFTFPAAFALSIEFGIICLVYTGLMLSYSKWLKKLILIDVMVIALGFVLRVAAGVMVIKVNYFSPWLFVLTTLLALYLGFGKRLSEIKLLENQAAGVLTLTGGKSNAEASNQLAAVRNAPLDKPLIICATGKYIGEGLGAHAGRFLYAIRRAETRAEFFRVCREHLDHDDALKLEPSETGP